MAPPDLRALISLGDVQSIRLFLETMSTDLSTEDQARYCYHLGTPCTDLPCLRLITELCNVAAEFNQPSVFAYLWDNFIRGPGASIPWPSLRHAALQGSIPLAEVFHSRDPGCFNVPEPAAPHGREGGGSQIKIAIRHDRFEYAEFILARGADINLGYPENSPLKEAVRSTAEDETSFRRIRFLVEHSTWVTGSGALEAARELDRSEVLHWLHHASVQENIGELPLYPLSGDTKTDAN